MVIKQKINRNQKKSIKAVYEDLLLAWNGCDAKSFGDLFSRSGDFIGFDGDKATGIHGIKRSLSGKFKTDGTGMVIGIVKEIRQIGGAVLVLHAIAGTLLPDKKDFNPTLTGVQTVVTRYDNKKYWVELFQTTPAVAGIVNENIISELRETLKVLDESHQLPDL
jgi:uncharacterized protein (TIGR02246 family)